jgi:hypothetical protein
LGCAAGPHIYWLRCWICVQGERQKALIFIFLSLQRLPKELRVIIGDEALEELANKMWTSYVLTSMAATVAAVEPLEEEGADSSCQTARPEFAGQREVRWMQQGSRLGCGGNPVSR